MQQEKKKNLDFALSILATFKDIVQYIEGEGGWKPLFAQTKHLTAAAKSRDIPTFSPQATRGLPICNRLNPFSSSTFISSRSTNLVLARAGTHPQGYFIPLAGRQLTAYSL